MNYRKVLMGACALAFSIQAKAEFVLDAINLPMLYAGQTQKSIDYLRMLTYGQRTLPSSVYAQATKIDSSNEFERRESQEFMLAYLKNLEKIIDAKPQDLVVSDRLMAKLDDYDFDKKYFPVFLQLPPAVPPYSGSFYCDGAIGRVHLNGSETLEHITPCFAISDISANRRPYVLAGFSSTLEAQAFKENYQRGNIRPLLHIKQTGAFEDTPSSGLRGAKVIGQIGAVAPAVSTALFFQDTKSGAIWQATVLQEGIGSAKPRSAADAPRAVMPLAPEVPSKAGGSSSNKVLIKVGK